MKLETTQKIDLLKNFHVHDWHLEKPSRHIFIKNKMQTFDFTYTQRITYSSLFDTY